MAAGAAGSEKQNEDAQKRCYGRRCAAGGGRCVKVILAAGNTEVSQYQ